MALIDLKRTPKEKKEDAQEAVPSPDNQPDYSYGLCLHLEDDELQKLNITQLPRVGDEYEIKAVARVKSVSARDDDGGSESCMDLQITMMEATLEPSGEEVDSVAEEESGHAEMMAVGGRPKTMMTNSYRGRK